MYTLLLLTDLNKTEIKILRTLKKYKHILEVLESNKHRNKRAPRCWGNGSAGKGASVARLAALFGSWNLSKAKGERTDFTKFSVLHAGVV